MAEWIGYIAGLLTTLCYVPQAWHVISTRKTEGIHLYAYIILFTGIALWTLYGVMIVNWPIIVANAVALPLLLTIIVMKIRQK